ncbi:Scarecrow-like protein 3 [Sesamum angolense]|uniref:Scarecrow-like protein 3 n=1 Tax=Sesamum angolense TaxID=2727404 RepID=A0AAE2C3E1_9LAMI|nr:Scarecrow-like protein 3 [Sesamum angolense]
MAHRLNEEADKLDIPFQFDPIVSRLENLDVRSLCVKTGEAVAISSVLQLHSLLAVDHEMTQRYSPYLSKSPSTLQRVLQTNPCTLGEFLEKDVINACRASPDSASSSPISSAPPPKLTSFLYALCGLSPKLMVVTEQESNHNGFNLTDRITEALNFYAALFDCLESTVPRASIERQKIEKMLFGKEIKNIIACEGVDRTKRHEKLDKWIPRLELAGFGKVPLSYHVMLQARRLLQSSNYHGYKIKEEK